MKDEKRVISEEQRKKLIAWVWLANACGAGSTAGSLLLSRFPGGPGEIYAVDFSRKRIEGLKAETMEKLNHKDLSEAAGMVDWCMENGISIIPLADRRYPPLLKQILDRPLLIYCKGTLPDLSSAFCVAMVGTRSMSEYGSEQAYRMASALSGCGAVVVSGMARGIDTRAHYGALDAGGLTVAVLGCGIDRAYPSENKNLMERIAKQGAVITEFAPGTPPAGTNFPIRNRIISGLCQATLVVEASERSGALITARTAKEQGRDVYAIPGKIGEAGSAGVNSLVAGEKGKLVVTAQDLLSHYVSKYPHAIDLSRSPTFTSKRVSPLSEMRSVRRGGRYGGGERDAEWKSPVQKDPGDIRDHERLAQVEADITDHYFENPELQSMVDAHAAEGKNQVGEPIADKRKEAPPKSARKEKPLQSAGKARPPMSDRDRAVYEKMPDADTVTADELADESLPIYKVILSLTMLEAGGYIEALPGGYYKKK